MYRAVLSIVLLYFHFARVVDWVGTRFSSMTIHSLFSDFSKSIPSLFHSLLFDSHPPTTQLLSSLVSMSSSLETLKDGLAFGLLWPNGLKWPLPSFLEFPKSLGMEK